MPVSVEDLDRMRTMLWERDRELMHSDTPIEISGLDQGPVGFRGRTPALLKADRTVALVDANENYDRRLAMYEQGARFDTGPRVVALETLQPVQPTRPVAPSTALDEEPLAESAAGTLLLCGLAAGLGLLLVARRGASHH